MDSKRIKYVVDADETGLRLDKFLHQHLPEFSRTFYQKLIKKNHVTVNGQFVKPSYNILQDEIVQIELPAVEETGITAENIPLSILYQDKDLIVIDKPAGMIVHPGAGIKSGTLVNALLYHCRDLSGVGGRLRPGIVHRLDKNTSGLMVAAKNDYAHIQLAQQLALKTMTRKYQALVWSAPDPPQGMIETHLARSKRDRKLFTVSETGKKAITHYQVNRYYRFLSLLDIQLETGRTHQIRIHLNYLQHPVFGDPEYHGRNKQVRQLKNSTDRLQAQHLLTLISRQALHAVQLKFIHPSLSTEMNFHSPLPADFLRVLQELEKDGTSQ
jgi:23S rRNA pseudouridine1911/1915/1917 synthase